MKRLPSNLPQGKRLSTIDPNQALKQGDVVYIADAVREERNMVHPGRYLRVWSGVALTKGYLESVEEIVQIAYDYLYDRLVTLIKNDPESMNLSNNSN